MTRPAWRGLVLASVALLLTALLAFPAMAAEADVAFDRTWARSDLPVSAGSLGRTWIWGPESFTGTLSEPYAEAPGGVRAVRYYDKARMEVTNPDGDQQSPWYVTNGLLAREMVTGELQVGNATFEPYEPAEINLAGDLNDPNGPTYATFTALMNYAPIPEGWTIIQTVDRAGQVGANPSLASYGVTATVLIPETNHMVASVFWDFMHSTGMISVDGRLVEGALFPNPFSATGLPLTEAYWTTVRVNGVPKQVLVQVFERRVLTFTPDNPDGWEVEAGNVGRHYYEWRYQQLAQAGAETAAPPASESSSSDANGSNSSSENSSTISQSNECRQTGESPDGTQAVEQNNSAEVTQSGGSQSESTEQTQVCNDSVNQGP